MRANARINAGMSEHHPIPLVERLKQGAALWSAATGRSLGALATIVANHGSFFERLDSPGAGTTTATLEKFARYLSDPVNWPEGEVPEEVCRFAHAVGISAAACAASPDITAEIIGAEVPGPDVAKASGASGRTPAHRSARIETASGAGPSAVPDPRRVAPQLPGAGAADDNLAGGVVHVG